MLGHTGNVACHHIRYTGVNHRFTNGKSAGNRYQNIPGYVFGIFTGREYFSPGHNNGSYGNKEKHVQLYIRKSLLHSWQLSYRSTGNHQYQQNKGKPAFPFSRHRFVVFAISQQNEHGRFTPSLDERVIRHHYQRIAFTQHFVIQILRNALTASLDFLYGSSIVTLKIEITQLFIDTGKTGA